MFIKVWQFRYNRRHLLPKFECQGEISIDLEFNILAVEQTNTSIQRLFVTPGYDVLVFNVADEGRLYSKKQDLHVRPIVAMLFVEQRDVLVTAGRDGSSLLNDIVLKIIFAYFYD